MEDEEGREGREGREERGRDSSRDEHREEHRGGEERGSRVVGHQDLLQVTPSTFRQLISNFATAEGRCFNCGEDGHWYEFLEELVFDTSTGPEIVPTKEEGL